MFHRFGSPVAPKELRARVLRACRAASEQAPRHWIDRIWESQPLRLTWAIAMIALLCLSLAVESAAPAPHIFNRPSMLEESHDDSIYGLSFFGFARSRSDRTLATTYLLFVTNSPEFEQ